MPSFSGYSTDDLARRVFLGLVRDFRALHGQGFARSAEQALLRGIADYRSFDWPQIGNTDPSRFKAWMQLRGLFKKHIFTHDVYTPEQLEEKTNESYVSSQCEFAVWREVKPRTFAVLQEARRIAKDILGDFSMHDVASNVKIGRRATLGNPRNEAFLDRKVGDPKAFTCPSAARKWFFNSYLPDDPLLAEVVKSIFKKSKKENIPVDLAVDYLKLVNVEKSWKTFRGITPLTMLGLFLSYGVGVCIEERLKLKGLNIKTLQAKHRRLARRYSKPRVRNGRERYGSHCTVDLKRASDSIMSQHLNYVLPRAWYSVVKKTFVRQIRVGTTGDRTIYTCSVLPMGNGATFPIETLFFYSLIKAVGNLLKVKGEFSVYGDDLIYPSSIHPYVAQVFADLGISVNVDKSFVNSFFRESCGGDYFRGVDVRPAMLPSTASHLKRKEYAAYIYKVANALRARWADEEIPETLKLLLIELAITQRTVFQVPLHFPSTAGWKVKTPNFSQWWIPWEKPKVFFQHGQKMMHFKYLGQATPEGIDVVSEKIYYWESLRAMSRRQAPAWRFWDTWLNEIPGGERPLHEHAVFRFRRVVDYPYVKGKRQRRIVQIPQVPSKEDVGFHVVDKLIPQYFWELEAVER